MKPRYSVLQYNYGGYEKPAVLSEDDVLAPGQRTPDSLQRWMNLRATC